MQNEDEAGPPAKRKAHTGLIEQAAFQESIQLTSKHKKVLLLCSAIYLILPRHMQHVL